MDDDEADAAHRRRPRDGRRREAWLLVAYYANCEGRASSHHVDDRLPSFAGHGIDVTLLSSMCGARQAAPRAHLRAFSPLPAGLLHELGRCRRRVRHRGVAARVAWLPPLLLAALPAALARPLERALSDHDKRWSWRFSAVLRALPWVLRHRPDVIYTIGGPASAHAAGRWLARACGARLVCQFQDPLHFQYPPTHPRRHRFHARLERVLAREAWLLVYLTRAAAAAARERLPPGTPILANPAGAVPRPPSAVARNASRAAAPSGSPRVLTHLGTLADTRNLDVLFAALSRMAHDDPTLGERFRLRLAGSLDRHVRASIEAFALRDAVEVLGKLEREAALALADASDVLLLVQNRGPVARETIPSKAYEYLCAARPVLALVDDNAELVTMLREHGHLAVRFDDARAELPAALATVIDGALPVPRRSALTAAAGVRRLIERVRREPMRRALPEGVPPSR